MNALEERVSFRLFKNRRKMVLQYVKFNKGVFENEGHFYRCAVEKLLADCQKQRLATGRKYRKVV